MEKVIEASKIKPVKYLKVVKTLVQLQTLK